MESPMTKAKIFATAAILASALASPAMAQQVIYNPGYCAQFYPNANCQNLGPGNPYTGSYQRRAAEIVDESLDDDPILTIETTREPLREKTDRGQDDNSHDAHPPPTRD